LEGRIARKPDTTNIREGIVFRNGKRRVVYQVRVRLQDDRGVARHYTKTFDVLSDAILYRDRRRSQVKLARSATSLRKKREWTVCNLQAGPVRQMRASLSIQLVIHPSLHELYAQMSHFASEYVSELI
jgi:hypothetical protein